jgi:hypothetical protein
MQKAARREWVVEVELCDQVVRVVTTDWRDVAAEGVAAEAGDLERERDVQVPIVTLEADGVLRLAPQYVKTGVRGHHKPARS